MNKFNFARREIIYHFPSRPLRDGAAVWKNAGNKKEEIAQNVNRTRDYKLNIIENLLYRKNFKKKEKERREKTNLIYINLCYF